MFSNEDRNTVTLTLPKIVHNMNACADGSILELKHPLFIEKYGEGLFSTRNSNESDAEHLVISLLDEGIYATTLSYDSLYVSHKGIHIEVELISKVANKYVLIPLLKFLLENIREEQEDIFNKTLKEYKERVLNSIPT